MFCGKTENNKINEIHKRTLRCVYNEQEKTLNDLLIQHQDQPIHIRNIQSLMSIIYSSIKGFCPDIALNFFQTKKVNYSLRSSSILILPKCNTNKYGTNSIFFKGSLLWNSLPNFYKECDSEESFKTKIKQWNPRTCTCNICTM